MTEGGGGQHTWGPKGQGLEQARWKMQESQWRIVGERKNHNFCFHIITPFADLPMPETSFAHYAMSFSAKYHGWRSVKLKGESSLSCSTQYIAKTLYKIVQQIIKQNEENLLAWKGQKLQQNTENRAGMEMGQYSGNWVRLGTKYFTVSSL